MTQVQLPKYGTVGLEESESESHYSLLLHTQVFNIQYCGVAVTSLTSEALTDLLHPHSDASCRSLTIIFHSSPPSSLLSSFLFFHLRRRWLCVALRPCRVPNDTADLTCAHLRRHSFQVLWNMSSPMLTLSPSELVQSRAGEVIGASVPLLILPTVAVALRLLSRWMSRAGFWVR